MPYRQITCLLLAALTIEPVAQSAAASSKRDRSDADTASVALRVKEGVRQLGSGPDARVKLRLRDNTKLEGYVSQVSDTDFVVMNEVGVATTVQYPDVTQVQGNNLRTRWKVVIAAAVVTGIIITLYIVRGAFCDGC